MSVGISRYIREAGQAPDPLSGPRFQDGECGRVGSGRVGCGRLRGADSDCGGFGSRVRGGADGACVYPGLGEICGETGDLTGVFLGLLVRNVAGRG